MSSERFLTIRNNLIADATLVALVPSSQIVIGEINKDTLFPTITMSQVGGIDIGLTGYRTASQGNKVARETVLFQINIYSRTNRKNTYDILDAVKDVMLQNSFYKTVDRDDWYEPLKAYYKQTVWRNESSHND